MPLTAAGDRPEVAEPMEYAIWLSTSLKHGARSTNAEPSSEKDNAAMSEISMTGSLMEDTTTYADVFVVTSPSSA